MSTAWMFGWIAPAPSPESGTGGAPPPAVQWVDESAVVWVNESAVAWTET